MFKMIEMFAQTTLNYENNRIHKIFINILIDLHINLYSHTNMLHVHTFIHVKYIGR